MPLFGPPNVDKLKAKQNIRGLIQALADEKHPGVAEAAADALVEAGLPAVDALIATWGQGKDNVNLRVAEVLRQIGTPAVQPLIRALADPMSQLTREKYAVIVLGQIGDADAVEPLGALLGAGWSSSRQSAIKALGQIGGTRAAELVIPALWDEFKPEREEATAALRRIGGAAAGPLAAALLEKRLYAREISEVLEQLGWEPGMDEAGAVYHVGRRNWTMCERIGAPAVPVLVAALADYSVRTMAAYSLARLGDSRAVEALARIAATSGPEIVSQSAAVEALGWVCDAGAVKILIAALEDRYRAVRVSAARSLVRLYRSGKLDAASEALILGARGTMSRPHDDEDPWCKPHYDTGIGVDLPL